MNNILTPLEFEKRFDFLIDRMWTLQLRVEELIEFEKQWSDLFELLKKKTGKDCTINIRNYDLLKSFHWDKYHILISDLHSILKNEVDRSNPNRLLKQFNKHFHLKPLESYFDLSVEPKVMFGPNFRPTESELDKFKNDLRIDGARRIYDAKTQGLCQLFPNIDKSTYIVKDSDIEDLLTKILNLKAEIESKRNYFNHKYEESATNRHASAVQNIDINEFKKITNKLFEIFNNIGNLYKDTTYAKPTSNADIHISDQIDLILFGTIQLCLFEYYDGISKDYFYSDARTAYFESDKILKIID